MPGNFNRVSRFLLVMQILSLNVQPSIQKMSWDPVWILDAPTCALSTSPVLCPQLQLPRQPQTPIPASPAQRSHIFCLGSHHTSWKKGELHEQSPGGITWGSRKYPRQEASDCGTHTVHSSPLRIPVLLLSRLRNFVPILQVSAAVGLVWHHHGQKWKSSTVSFKLQFGSVL